MKPWLRKTLIGLGIFVGLYVIYLGVAFYLHPDDFLAQYRLRKSLNEYYDMYRNDKYGGKTPQETLDLFIKALEANDPELATKYFMPDDNGSREKWHKVMVDAYNAGKLQGPIDLLKKAVPDKERIIGNKFYGFATRDENGDVILDVSLQFNGLIWKIESL